MNNNVFQFIIKVIVTFIIYGFCLWLFNAIFDKEYKVDDSLIFQSALFSIFWAIYLTRSKRKKKSNKNPCHNK